MKLTIILGKRIGTENNFPDLGRPIRYPEIKFHSGSVIAPQHPDDFVHDTLGWIKELMKHGKDVQLWTMSQDMIAAIAEDVHDDPGFWNQGPNVFPEAGATGVEIHLFDDDNVTFRKYGISRDGVLCDAGYGHWPFGWFMLSR